MREFFCSVFFLSVVLSSSSVFAAQDEDKNAAVSQARRDYRVFLEQLRELNDQYKQITGEVSKVLQEEGVPVFDEDTGDLSIQKPPLGSTSLRSRAFGEADVSETESEVVVTMDLPGMKKQAIKVSVKDNKLLRIEGQREETKEVQKESGDAKYYRFERQHGSFLRSIELPVPVKDTGTEARYENGVLTVRLPKAETLKKEIAVSVR